MAGVVETLNTRSNVSKWFAALAGMAAAASALAIGEFVAVLAGPESAPLVAVGGVVIDHVPDQAKELAIRLFGTHDKSALQVGTVVILLALAAVVGILGALRLWYGLAGIGVFGLVGIVSALTRAGATAGWVAPSLIGGVVAAVVLWWLLRLARNVAAASQRTTRPRELEYFGQQRRRFLTVT